MNKHLVYPSSSLASELHGVVSSENSSVTPLGANQTFTGTAVELTDFSAINVAAFSDVSSATDGLKMQFSPDGVNWDHSHNFSVTGNIGVSYAQAAELRYFRIVYVNGATAQTVFRLTVILKRSNVSPSRYTLVQNLSDAMMADVTKTVIWGKTTGGGGGYVPVKVNPSGALTVEVSGDVLTAILDRSSGTVLSGVDWDYFSVSYPTSTQEIFRYYQGGAGGTLVRTVTMNYADATKVQLINCGYT